MDAEKKQIAEPEPEPADCRPGESARRAFDQIEAQMPAWLLND